MPLLDHFHSPLLDDPPWTSLYTLWASAVVRWLNRTLPAGEFRAFANVRLGANVEADVAEFRRLPENGMHSDPLVNGGGLATLSEAPPALASFPLAAIDDIEVQIAESKHHMTIAGVIEFVSPANKKELAERRAFVAKCASYLHRGIGVVVVDIVTNRHANLHNELMQALGGPPSTILTNAPTYISAYGPVQRAGRMQSDVWCSSAAVGSPIPSVPLALRRGPLVMLELEETYEEAIGDSGL
ncbi:MAG: DUF4058 domain-containing protein [Gemmataceae bacterium]